MMRTIFVSSSLFLGLLLANAVFPQHAYRGWQVYTSFKDTRAVDFSAGKIWAAATGGLYTFDAASGSQITVFTNLDGLRNVELNSVYVDNSGNVWSGALDGSISIYLQSSGSWRYITDIQTSNETNKKINHMFQNGNSLFLATEFGIIKLDVIRFQILEQYIYPGPLIDPKPPVNKLLVVNDTIWAATRLGIAYADVRNFLPIRENWANFTLANTSVLKTNRINTVAYFAGRVILGTDSGMVAYSGNTLTRYEPLLNGQPLTSRPIIDIAVDGNSMYIAVNNEIYRVDASNPNQAQVFASGFAINSLEANNGNLFIATPSNGVVRNSLNNRVLPNGPNSNLFLYAEIDREQNVWGSSGGTGFGIYRFNGTTWKNFNTEVYPWMGGNLFPQLYASPRTGIVWASGFGNGLGKIVGDSIFIYNDQNSCLVAFAPGFVLVEGVREDSNGKVWLINRAPTDGKPIVNFTDCVRYPPPPNSNSTTFKVLAIDKYDTKWMTNHPNGDEGVGICYFNEQVPSSNSIPAEALGQDMRTVNDIIVDKNGEVWVATDNGIAILSDPYVVISNPNANNLPFVKMRIIENGISTPLTENCLTIRADALNNKWVATFNGLLYLSPDGSTILAQYNINNSPLLENRVFSIAVNPGNGKVYFGTSKGLVSYTTLAVEPLADCDRIAAGPNPYLIPNEVKLRIDGFVEGSTVKILTISGTLVREFESPGGRVAEWDGRDENGNLVATGIYIIAGYNKDASKVCTGKVAVVRK